MDDLSPILRHFPQLSDCQTLEVEELTSGITKMKVMSDLREAMWAQFQIGVSKLDFDYAGNRQKYFERFETSTNSSGYTDWLGAV